MMSMYEAVYDGVSFDSVKNMFSEAWGKLETFNADIAIKAKQLISISRHLKDLEDIEDTIHSRPICTPFFIKAVDTLRIGLRVIVKELNDLWSHFDTAWVKFHWLMSKFLERQSEINEPATQIACEWLSNHYKMDYIKKFCAVFAKDFRQIYDVIEKSIENFQLEAVIRLEPFDDSCEVAINNWYYRLR